MNDDTRSPRLALLLGIPVRWAGLVLAATLVAICASFSLLLWNARIAERDKASTAASNLSAALTQDLARNIDLYDLALRGVLEALSDPAVINSPPALRQRMLFGRAASAPYLGSIIVEDAAGTVLFDSASATPRSQTYADRAYFKSQRDNANLGLLVSEPFIGKVDHEWVVNLSRRIDKPDGSFGGVVCGTLKLDYLHHLFARMKLGSGGSLTLFRTDGTVMMREPYDPALLGQVKTPALLFERLAEAPEGEYQARSVIDGVERLYHYQRVGDLPLVQNVAWSLDDIYADWWHKAVEVTALLATACLIIASLAWNLRTELRRRVDAETMLVALAREDALTKLANRRRFDEALATEMQRAARHGWPVSLLMIDADHFKTYNDAFGHLAGDAALVSLAACLTRRTHRSGDLAARYGGEEFAVILPHVGADAALSLAESMRADVLALGLRTPKGGALSVSIGIASVSPQAGDHPGDLIDTADVALYRSKAEGRNRSTLLRALERSAGRPGRSAEPKTPAGTLAFGQAQRLA